MTNLNITVLVVWNTLAIEALSFGNSIVGLCYFMQNSNDYSDSNMYTFLLDRMQFFNLV